MNIKTTQLSFLDYDHNWINIKLEQLFRIIKTKYPHYYFHMVESKTWHPEIVLCQKKISLRIYIIRDADLKIWKNHVLVHFSLSAKNEGCGLAVNNFEDFYKYLDIYIQKFDNYLEEMKC